jgi:hypothetical protein
MGGERWRPFRFERLDPFRDLLEMQSEMSRAMDQYYGRQTGRAQWTGCGPSRSTSTRPRMTWW